MFGLQNFGRLGSSGRVAALPSLIAQLFTPGTVGFCGGMSVTEAYDNGWLFADDAGTTPAALNGPVGLVLGQVGSINASQTTSTKRPTLKDDGSGHLYLEFDGTDDCFVTPSIDLTGTDKVTVFAGVRKLSTSLGVICEFSADPDVGDGRFAVYSEYPSANDYSFYAHGAGGESVASFAHIAAAPPDSAVLTGTSDLLTQVNTIRRNGVDGTDNTSTWTPSMFANEPLYIGSRNQSAIFFNGRMYTLPIIVGRTVEPALILEVEAAINAAMGGIY